LKGFFDLNKEKREGRKKLIERNSSNKKELLPDDYCEICDLYKDCKSPKIDVCGDGKIKGLIVCEGPGKEEDREGKNLVGKVGKRFRKYFKDYDLDLEDFYYTNAVNCRPPNNRKPTNKELTCCYHRLKKVIEEKKPKVVFLLGDSAVNSYYMNRPDLKFFSSLPLSSCRGKVIPDMEYGCWVCHGYHPSYIERGNDDLEHIFELDFDIFIDTLDRKRPNIKWYENDVEILDEEQAWDFLNKIYDTGNLFAFDYETSSFRYYEGIHEIYLVSITTVDRTVVFYLTLRLLDVWKTILRYGDIPKIAQNLKHEHLASHWVLGVDTKGWDHDTMVASHVLDSSKRVTNLKVQTFIRWGYPDYGAELKSYMQAAPGKKNKFKEVPIEDGGLYCGRDSMFTYRLANIQKKELKAQGLERAYRLLHDGVEAFSRIEQNGIRFDVKEANRWKKELEDRIRELKNKVVNGIEARRFEKSQGRQLKYNKKLSDDDLRILLFDQLGMEVKKRTPSGKPSVDKEVLEEAKEYSELVGSELELRRLNKLTGTYLNQFFRLEVDGFIYPSFNLHLARSYRSSSDSPNFQNIPKRDEEAREIRKLIIPRDGNKIYTVDYGSMEVRILACQSRDPVLMEYIEGGGDMHGDQAEIVFDFKREDVSKEDFKKYRFITKNHWVFPLFYGSYYKSVARNTEPPSWFRPQQWESHLKDCEKKFWRKFKKTREWQDRKWEEYKKTGYITDGAWGFRRGGYLGRNMVYNFPIQGPAFHCLLWSIIEFLKRRPEWEDYLCGQIHDEMFFDAPPKIEKTLIKEVTKIMTEDIREANPWIIIPLEAEWSKGDNWFEMEEF